ncbi:MAG: hypothetical protein ACREA0_14255 [bacterium]
MKIPVPTYRCSLGPMQPELPDLEAVKREGWQAQRILLVSEDDQRLDFAERQFIRRLGERLYGAKENRHG